MDSQKLLEAAAEIRKGNLVVFPTETVYGLGANAFDAKACAKIFELKGRPTFNPLIVHIADIQNLSMVVREVPEMAKRLMEQFWPGPLTLVLPKNKNIPGIVTAGLETVGIRMPAHPIALEFIKKSNVPIAAPSANLSNRISPTTMERAKAQLGNQNCYYLEGGASKVGLESTVIGFIQNRPVIYRLGGLSIETLETFLNEKLEMVSEKSVSPGQEKVHYAPQTLLRVIERIGEPKANSALLSLGPESAGEKYAFHKILSVQSDLVEASAHFFESLSELDEKGFSQIDILLFPEEGLGRALNDRIRRAASSKVAL